MGLHRLQFWIFLVLCKEYINWGCWDSPSSFSVLSCFAYAKMSSKLWKSNCVQIFENFFSSNNHLHNHNYRDWFDVKYTSVHNNKMIEKVAINAWVVLDDSWRQFLRLARFCKCTTVQCLKILWPEKKWDALFLVLPW
jgi:hypothetical protein